MESRGGASAAFSAGCNRGAGGRGRPRCVSDDPKEGKRKAKEVPIPRRRLQVYVNPIYLTSFLVVNHRRNTATNRASTTQGKDTQWSGPPAYRVFETWQADRAAYHIHHQRPTGDQNTQHPSPRHISVKAHCGSERPNEVGYESHAYVGCHPIMLGSSDQVDQADNDDQ